MRSLPVALVGLGAALVLGVLPAAPVGAGQSPVPAAAPAATSVAPARAAAPTAPDNYTPDYGARFNSPHGNRAGRRRILGHIIRTIDSVPSYQRIRIATWNLRSDDIVDALVRAHRRGVSVRVIVDRLNADRDTPNPNVRRLRRELPEGQAQRQPSQTSFVKLCAGSCRAVGGIAHSKYYLFSKAGPKKDVVMFGSANATDLAAYHQWNDTFTITGKPLFFKKFEEIFDQSVLDRPVEMPYQTLESGALTAYFYPKAGFGPPAGDPVLDTLGRVRCKGATGGTGIRGRTSIRIAMTAMHGNRGIRIAERLAQLNRQGCNIKIVYAVFGNNVLKILRRGGVRKQQIVTDYGNDNLYEEYLHMKDLAISGVYDGRTDTDVTFNGTANWTGLAIGSDEVVMRIFGSGTRRQYADYVDYLFSHPPRHVHGRELAAYSRVLSQEAAQSQDPNRRISLD